MTGARTESVWRSMKLMMVTTKRSPSSTHRMRERGGGACISAGEAGADCTALLISGLLLATGKLITHKGHIGDRVVDTSLRRRVLGLKAIPAAVVDLTVFVKCSWPIHTGGLLVEQPIFVLQV